MEKRNIVFLSDLTKEWQDEAVSNLGDHTYEASFLEPEEGQNPEEHILWDLSECIIQKGIYEGFEYDGAIIISNNSTMLLKFDNEMETALIKFI